MKCSVAEHERSRATVLQERQNEETKCYRPPSRTCLALLPHSGSEPTLGTHLGALARYAFHDHDTQNRSELVSSRRVEVHTRHQVVHLLVSGKYLIN